MTTEANKEGVQIPWQRLTTPYGRGTELPALIEQGAYGEIGQLIEHQGTLWQVTPWVLSVLLQQLKTKQPSEVSLNEIVLYKAVVEALEGHPLADAVHVPNMTMLLDEAYLWPEDEEEDEEAWEEEPAGYAELPFSSYYYYSYLLLQEAVPTFERVAQENEEIVDPVSRLIEMISQLK